MSEYATEIALILGLVIVNGLLAAAEIALVTARRHALEIASNRGSAGARAALSLTEDPSRFLAAIQVGITLAGFMASATAAVSLAGLVQGWLDGLGLPWSPAAATATAVFLVTLAVSYVTLVLGELAPKRFGLHHAEKVAAAVARPVALLARVTAPVTWVLSRSTDAVVRLLGVRGAGRRPAVSEDEIRLLVAEQAGLREEEKRMIHEIFDLGDTVAREIMVPRVDAVMVEDVDSVAAALENFASSGFSRLPVYREDPDTVVGLLLLKDLVPVMSTRECSRPVSDFMREATFVPETKQVLVLMKEMQAARNAMVIVVDEHGGTAGLLTLEDIIEEVIGEIVDEYDREERYVTELAPGEWIVDGRCAVQDAREVLGVDFPDSEEYETLAGWMLVQLGHIPVPGETIEYDGATIRVQTVRRRRIARLRITRGDANAEDALSE